MYMQSCTGLCEHAKQTHIRKYTRTHAQFGRLVFLPRTLPAGGAGPLDDDVDEKRLRVLLALAAVARHHVQNVVVLHGVRQLLRVAQDAHALCINAAKYTSIGRKNKNFTSIRLKVNLL